MIPESLCWHVLEGVTNALLWLHYGYQKSSREIDWNPIALINIHPGASMFSYHSSLSPPSPVPLFSSSKERKYPPLLTRNENKTVYFTAPRGDETYGVAKVSSFDDAIVMRKGQAAHDAVRVKTRVRDKIGNYVAPVSIGFSFFISTPKKEKLYWEKN